MLSSVVKHPILKDYYSILQIRQTWTELINMLIYQILAYIYMEKDKKVIQKKQSSLERKNEEFELPEGPYSLSDSQDYFD